MHVNHSLSIAQKRLRRVRAKVVTAALLPRLCIHRSNRYISGQVIDLTGKVVASLSSRSFVADSLKKGNKTSKTTKADGKTTTAVEKAVTDKVTKTAAARQVGLLLAKAMLEKGLKAVVFDRGAFRYHGRVRALADGVREGGVQV